MSCELLDRTRDLLKHRHDSLPKIAEATGLSVSWLSMLLSRPDVDPAVSKTVKLYEYLTGDSLFTEE